MANLAVSVKQNMFTDNAAKSIEQQDDLDHEQFARRNPEAYGRYQRLQLAYSGDLSIGYLLRREISSPLLCSEPNCKQLATTRNEGPAGEVLRNCYRSLLRAFRI